MFADINTLLKSDLINHPEKNSPMRISAEKNVCLNKTPVPAPKAAILVYPVSQDSVRLKRTVPPFSSQAYNGVSARPVSITNP